MNMTPLASGILVYDTETTGLPLHPSAPLAKQPKIIEWGGAILSRETGEIMQELNVLINPGEKLEDVITKITGITDADLVDALPFEAVLPQIRLMFEGADAVVAHNLPFDKSMMRFALARIDIDLLAGFPWPENEFCTVGLYRDKWGRNPKLIELYEWSLGKPLAQTHRAIDDVRALVEVIQEEELWRDM